ncbi:MAG: ABC transporter permease [Actinomycetota bacterium]
MEEFIASTLRSGTPLALAAVGALFAVRAGIFHLGIEGLMLASAFSAVAVAHSTSSVALALVAGVIVAAVLSVLYWALMEYLAADAVIAGLGLTTLCVGGSAFLLDALFDQRGRLDSPVGLPRPVRGAESGPAALVTELSILGWLTPLIVLLAWVVLRRSRLGLRITAVGTHPYGAKAAGVPEGPTRLAAMLLASVGAALAGVELALGGLSGFSEGMTAGRGFIALAAVLLGLSRPFGTAASAFFFGAAAAVGIYTQINSIDVLPRPFILMIPFVVTIVAVAIRAAAESRSSAAN